MYNMISNSILPTTKKRTNGDQSDAGDGWGIFFIGWLFLVGILIESVNKREEVRTNGRNVQYV